MNSLFANQSSAQSAFVDADNILGNINISISSFPISEAIEKKTWYISLKENFDTQIKNRVTYIDSLNKIGRNWISGGGEAPNDIVIALGKKILTDLGEYFKGNDSISIPKIIIGPLPHGGICIELHVDKENALYVTVGNNNKIDVDVKYFDYYSSIDLNTLNVSGKVIKKYESLTST